MPALCLPINLGFVGLSEWKLELRPGFVNSEGRPILIMAWRQVYLVKLILVQVNILICRPLHDSFPLCRALCRFQTFDVPYLYLCECLVIDAASEHDRYFLSLRMDQLICEYLYESCAVLMPFVSSEVGCQLEILAPRLILQN